MSQISPNTSPSSPTPALSKYDYLYRPVFVLMSVLGCAALVLSEHSRLSLQEENLTLERVIAKERAKTASESTTPPGSVSNFQTQTAYYPGGGSDAKDAKSSSQQEVFQIGEDSLHDDLTGFGGTTSTLNFTAAEVSAVNKANNPVVLPLLGRSNHCVIDKIPKDQTWIIYASNLADIAVTGELAGHLIIRPASQYKYDIVREQTKRGGQRDVIESPLDSYVHQIVIDSEDFASGRVIDNSDVGDVADLSIGRVADGAEIVCPEMAVDITDGTSGKNTYVLTRIIPRQDNSLIPSGVLGQMQMLHDALRQPKSASPATPAPSSP